MFCRNCGTKFSNSDKYCRNCGRLLAVNLNNLNSRPTGKKNKSLSSIFIVLAFIFIAIGTILFINKGNFFNSYKGKRTIMVYMIGSDLESKYVSASIDIEEMIQAKPNLENVNILIYTGGAKEWHRDEISSDENAIFKVVDGGIQKIKTYERLDMGNATTLLDFINYGYTNYKAENYSLILWDHGGGPIYGYGYDEYNTNNVLTLLELKQVLEKSPFGNDKKLEFIGFDACLMATAEVSYLLSDYANYMVASQEVEPGAGWDYSFLSSINSNTTTYDLGKKIVDTYGDYYANKINGKGTSLSLLKLDRIDKLENMLNTLFREIDENLTIDFSVISRSRSYTKTFGKVTSNGYDLVDLYDLINRLPTKYGNYVDNLKDLIDEFVIYERTDLTGANGISIYFPYDNKNNIENIIFLYKRFGFANEYTNFIDNFSSKLTGTRLHDWALSDNKPIVTDSKKIEIELPQDVLENYSKASYIIFEKSSDNYYAPVVTGSDVTLDGNILSTTTLKKALVAKDGKGEETYITVLESERGQDYTKYIIPGTLQNWDDDLLSNFEMLPVYLQFVVDDENPLGRVAGAIEVLTDEENETSPKVAINIDDWKMIQLLNYKYKIFDDTGNYITDWTSSEEVSGFEAEIKNGFILEFKDLDKNKEYYALFRIADSQGNIYNTNIVKVNK